MTEKELAAALQGNPELAACNPDVLERPRGHRVKRPREATDRMTGLEKKFLVMWRLCGGDALDWLYAQNVFPDRPRMHVDFKHVRLPVAVEIDGGQYMARSGHNNAAGVQRDAEKLALCNKHGLRLFRLTTAMVTVDGVQVVMDFVKETSE